MRDIMKKRLFWAVMALMLVPFAAAQKKWDQIDIPEMNPIKEIKPERFVLEHNGMVIYLVEDHELPTVSARIRLRGGSLFDPEDKVGLADATATVLRDGGTEGMPSDELNRFLENRGASIEVSFGDQTGFVSAFMLREDRHDVLKTMFDLLRQPAFPEEKLEKAKIQFKSSISRRNDDNGAIARREFSRLIYGENSPYARNMEYSHVANMNRDDLVAYHYKFFQPQNMMLGIVGDFDAKEMKAWLKKALADWKGNPQFEAPELPAVDYEWRNKVYFAQKGDVAQAQLRIGHIGGRYDDEDYYAMDLFSAILGGANIPFAKLFSEVRTERGLAYSAWGRWMPGFNNKGLFIMGGSTKTPSTVEAIKVFVDTLKDMLENEVSEEELRVAKDSILSSFVFNFDSKSEVLDRHMLYEFYGYPQDFLQKYQKGIQKTTAAEVLAAAKRNIKPDQMIYFVSGNMAELGTPLTELGLGEPVEVDIEIPEPKTEKVAATSETLAKGKAIMEKVHAVYGGDSLEDLKAIKTAGDATVTMGAQEMAMSQESLLSLEKPMTKAVITMPMGKMVSVTTPDGGWSMRGGAIQDVPPGANEHQVKEWYRKLHVMLRNGGVTYQFLTEGEDGRVVRASVDAMEDLVVDLTIDAENRVVKSSYSGKNPMTGAPAQVELSFSDFTEVNGVLFAKSTTMTMDGKPFFKMTFTDLIANPEGFDEAFAKPEQN